MVEIRRIDKAHERDAELPNEPFTLWGRMIPSLENGVWAYRTEQFPEPAEMCFPDFPYNVTDKNSLFLGAYAGDVCVGLAVFRKAMFRYMYLEDLKVNRDCRRQGIGAKLIEAGMKTAKELGLVGIYTVGQDNNLSACLFYLKNGFQIGGFNNRDYRGTPQGDKADIYFYRDC